MDPRYRVVFGACLTQFTIIGLLFSYGLFFDIFEEEFGWSRTFLSACSASAFFMMGALAMVGGRLNDRFGPRPVLAATGLIYGVGFALISQISAPWHLMAIFALLLSLGMATHDVVTLSTIARLFARRRGVMSGVVKVGTAAGQVATPPTAAFAIALLGWRDATVALGAAAATLLLIAAFSMKAPATSAASAAPTGNRSGADGASYAEARAGRAFRTMCAIQFLFFPTLMSVPLHIVVHGGDLGMTPAEAATLLSVLGGCSVAGRLLVGGSTDRLGGRLAYAICLIPLIASLILLTVIVTPAPLYLAMAIYGFGHGGLFTVVSPTVAEIFGMRSHGAIFGTILFFGTIGGALGPIAAGAAFDATGSYDPAFIGLATMAALALGLALTLPRRGEAPPTHG